MRRATTVKIDSNKINFDSPEMEFKSINYDPTGKPNSQRAIDEAEAEGLDVLFPEPNQLFIDIDNEQSLATYQKHYDIVEKHIGVIDEKVTPSRRKEDGKHIILTLKRDVTEYERLLLQACLGSDRMRELLGYVQAFNNDQHPTLFLEKKVTLLTEGNNAGTLENN